MKTSQYLCFMATAISACFFAACGNPPVREQPAELVRHAATAVPPDSASVKFDFNPDIASMTMQELRLLRSSVYARRGMLFDESDLRRYWQANSTWYDTLSHSQHAGSLAGETIILPADGQALADKIDNRITQLRQENYIHTGYDTVANIMNVVNLFQFGEITRQEIMDDLAADNYAVVPDTLPQLFQIYRRNDTLQLPSFVTADLLIQLSHVYETCVLRTVEETYFIPMLAELCLALYQASMEQAGKAAAEEIRNMAHYNAVFYAVPYHLLTGKPLKVPAGFQITMEEELAYIAQNEDHTPSLLPLKASFPYSAFKPYGHYNRTAGLRRYFRALKWLQLAPYCLDSKQQLRQAVFAAVMLQSAKTKSYGKAIDLYARLSGSMAWFTGQPAGVSVYDVAGFLQKERITGVAAALNGKNITAMDAALKKAVAARTLPVRHAQACAGGICFFPQPGYIDDEVLQGMADPHPNAERAYPKVLDIFAAFGSQPAFDKLFSDNCEDTLRTAYPVQLAEMKSRMHRFTDWNNSSYNKRLECLLAMQQTPRHSQPAMQQAWNRKVLATASASWTKMRHDMLLYGVIPDHPEPLDTVAVSDTLPEAVTLGYVEPNLPFWAKLREWVELTGKTLERYQLVSDSISRQTALMHRYVAMMEDAARKEINNQRLDDETYRLIAHIGDSIAQLTLSMIEPQIDRWAWTAGSGHSVAISEGVYQRNIKGCDKNGTLYAATGDASAIYVITEIDGLLYLTKGAVFDYYEFFMPPGKNLSENDWREMRKWLKAGDHH